jgi:hypothetical protein
LGTTRLSKLQPGYQTLEPSAEFGVIAAGTRRVSTGRNGDRWTQLILPVSNCGSNASVRVGI